MDAKQKIILACLVGLLCAGVAWYLFSVPSTGPTDSYHVEDGFDRTAREQQKATDSIDAVSRGLEESTGCATDIGTGIEADQRRADSIQSRNAEIETGIDSITERKQSQAAGNSLAEAQKYLDDTRTEFLKNEKAHEKTERGLKNRIKAWQAVAAILCGVAITR